MIKTLATMCIILLLIPSSSIVIQGQAKPSTPDWPDGTFQGTWTIHSQTTNFQGTLNQGRRDSLGTFTAYDLTNTTLSYTGAFAYPFLIGHWATDKNSLILGLLYTKTNTLKGLLFTKNQGLIRFSATYTASFLPALTGPYTIGASSYLIDTNNPENFTPDPNDTRSFIVQLWYPLAPNANGNHALYMDAPTFLWLKNQSPIPMPTIPNNAYKFVHPHALLSHEVAPGLHPLIIFSPGYDGVYQIYTSLIEDLASHGYIVAAMNHPYVSGITVFPDGHIIDIATPPSDPVEQEAFMNMSLRSIVNDAKATLDFLAQMNQTDIDFKGTLDLGRVGMYGHSFGGGNTGVCLLEDSRIKAGLTLDGYFNTGFLNGTITKPLMMLVQEARFVNDTNTQYVWYHTSADTYKVGINGSTHYAFTDVGTLLSHLVPLIPPKLLGFGTIPPKRMVNITRTYEQVFFDVYLNGRPRQDLLNLTAQFPEARIDYKLGS